MIDAGASPKAVAPCLCARGGSGGSGGSGGCGGCGGSGGCGGRVEILLTMTAP